MKKDSVIIYPGTFDPITLGHIDVIKRGRKLFDKLIVAVVGSSAKGTLFTVEERVEMIRDAVGESRNLVIESFDGLLVDYVNKRGVNAVLRGLRAVSDFEYEFQMALINRKINEEVETIFMMTADRYSYISSRFIKEIARLGGSVDCFVPENVAKKLKEEYRR
ncbi:MAG: pantetheine-phosphate adenylyltransferase [Deltaproteobacteria bacterium]|nr:pantetheine-phosphate adenylyltransferase [Deltaproteobacteria bacterium]